MKKIIVLIVLILFMLTGCSKANVDKKIKKTDDEVISYVNQELKSKYSNISISLSKKEQEYTLSDKCWNTCGRMEVKDAYRYTFKITDNSGNIAYAVYFDGYIKTNKNNKKKYDNKLIESYGVLNDQKENLEKYSNLLYTYFDKSTIKNKYSESVIRNVDNLYQSDNFYDIYFTYKINLNFDNISYDDYVKLDSFAYDQAVYNKNSLQHDVSHEIHLIFNNSEIPIRILGNGFEKITKEGYSENHSTYNMNDITLVNDYTDYYSIKDYFNNHLSNDELNTVFSYINTYLKPYVYKVGRINSKSYDNGYSNVMINCYTKNNSLFRIQISYFYDSLNKKYSLERIEFVKPTNLQETSLNGSVVKLWKIK